MASISTHPNLIKPSLIKMTRADTSRHRWHHFKHDGIAVHLLTNSLGLSSITRMDLDQRQHQGQHQGQHQRQQQDHQMAPEAATSLALSKMLPELELDLPPTTLSPTVSPLPPQGSTIHDSLEFRLAAAATVAADTLNTANFMSPNDTMDCADSELSGSLSPGSGQEATLCGTLTTSLHAAWGNTVSTAFSSSLMTPLLVEEEESTITGDGTAGFKHRSNSGSFSSSPISHDNVTRHKSNHSHKARMGIKLFSLQCTRYVR